MDGNELTAHLLHCGNIDIPARMTNKSLLPVSGDAECEPVQIREAAVDSARRISSIIPGITANVVSGQDDFFPPSRQSRQENPSTPVY